MVLAVMVKASVEHSHALVHNTRLKSSLSEKVLIEPVIVILYAPVS
jgi:hypothetical protein